MSEVSKNQHGELVRTLKQFALADNPMFVANVVQSVETNRSFTIYEYSPESSLETSQLDREETRVQLGFTAIRLAEKIRNKAVYEFEISVTVTQLRHPRQLEMSIDAWHDLAAEYLLDEVDAGGDGSQDDTQIIAEAESVTRNENMRQAVMKQLIDNAEECLEFKSENFQVSPFDKTAASIFERGLVVGGEVIESYSTENRDSVVDIPEGHETVDDLSEMFEARVLFKDLVQSLGLDVESEEEDLLTFEDKKDRILFILECMRTGNTKSML